MKNIHLSLYWKCQIAGWSLASLYWGFVGFIGGEFNYLLGIIQFVTDVVLYISLTHCYRKFALANNWQLLELKDLLKKIIPSVFILGIAYLIVTVGKIYIFRLWFINGYSEPLSQFFVNNGLGVFIAGVRLMSIWLLAYHLYQYAQREIRITKENAQLAIITKDAQLNNLSAQLNPHFLFNSLNNIKSLIIDNPDSARRAIDLLAELLRTSLYSNAILTTIKEEIDLIQDYLELEKLRLEERLQFKIEIEANIEHLLIPRLSIQTLVENAVKHGISQCKDGGLVHIQLVRKNGNIEITVKNPGKLDLVLATGGIGLTNLRERLRLEFKDKATFEIVSMAEGMVLSTISIADR